MSGCVCVCVFACGVRYGKYGRKKNAGLLKRCLSDVDGTVVGVAVVVFADVDVLLLLLAEGAGASGVTSVEEKEEGKCQTAQKRSFCAGGSCG